MKPLLIILFSIGIAQAQTLKPGRYVPDTNWVSFGGFSFTINTNNTFYFHSFSCTESYSGFGNYEFHDSILTFSFLEHPADTIHPIYTYKYEGTERKDSITVSFPIINKDTNETLWYVINMKVLQIKINS